MPTPRLRPIAARLALFLTLLPAIACTADPAPVGDTPQAAPQPAPSLASSAPIPDRKMTLEGAQLTLSDGTVQAYEIGQITVPVRRASGDPSNLVVEFFRFPRSAEAAPETPPLYILRGGPGSRTMRSFLDDPEYFEHRLAHLTQVTDVVIPGQRGFYESNATPCEPMRPLTAAEAQAPDDGPWKAAFAEAARACQAHWRDEGLDLRGLNALEAADDVAEIAAALSHDRIQVRGISFGSHWGMTLLRRYPELVARATFSGLEGPDHTYDMPSHVLAALERIAASAEASPALHERMPQGGLLAAYRELIERADAAPRTVTVAHPETGEPAEVRLDGDAYRQLSRGFTRGTAFRFLLADWPLDLLDLLEGRVDEAAADSLEALLDPDVGDAAFYQIDCASGLSEARGAELRSDPAAAVLGETWAYYDGVCEPWDADLGEAFRQAFTTDVPTLLVQGDWDTSTPYENAVELRPMFSNHRFIHVEGGSHGALREAEEDVEGFQDALLQWYRTGTFEHLPERVALPPMEWRAERHD